MTDNTPVDAIIARIGNTFGSGEETARDFLNDLGSAGFDVVKRGRRLTPSQHYENAMDLYACIEANPYQPPEQQAALAHQSQAHAAMGILSHLIGRDW